MNTCISLWQRKEERERECLELHPLTSGEWKVGPKLDSPNPTARFIKTVFWVLIQTPHGTVHNKNTPITTEQSETDILQRQFMCATWGLTLFSFLNFSETPFSFPFLSSFPPFVATSIWLLFEFFCSGSYREVSKLEISGVFLPLLLCHGFVLFLVLFLCEYVWNAFYVFLLDFVGKGFIFKRFFFGFYYYF